MENSYNQWHDPLLATDASWQRESNPLSKEAEVSSSTSLVMVNPDSTFDTRNDVSEECKRSKLIELEKSSPRVARDAIDGRSMLGFSLTSPDLVICAGSPDVPRKSYADSPEFIQKRKYSTELSLENGIDDSDTKNFLKTPTVKFSTICQTFGNEFSPESSFELPAPPETERVVLNDLVPIISINSGSTDECLSFGSVNFLEDNCFRGGDTIRTNAVVGHEEGCTLYQTARFGNFVYKFQSLDPGEYLIDLHFAEIVFTEGPPGIRVFDIFIQGAKVISSLDIYSQVGGNNPLVIADLRMFVGDARELSIRFEGVVGSPLVCGISVRKDGPANAEEAEPAEVRGTTGISMPEPAENIVDCMEEGGLQKFRQDYECQKKELAEMKRAMEELTRENQLKNKEYQEAWSSLKELQNELMRKSMHVGSLAFAIEGQVKEKSRWFSSLRDLTRKLKIMKMEQIKLLEDSSAYKRFLDDMNGMSSFIQSRMIRQAELHEDMKAKYVEGTKERKELYNKIIELKGNIRVFCRCRPLNTDEIAAGDSFSIDFEPAKDGELIVMSNRAPKKSFKFDSVFGPQACQADVFQETAPFATSVLDGYNACIFAYGQTGTGKTFTMEGTEEDRGVNYRTLERLFQIIKEREKLYRYDISVSVLEVYNEQIRDLLVSGFQTGPAAKRLEIRQAGEGVHHVPGVVEAHVKSISEVWEVLKTGSSARAVGSTNANDHSSRSHCIHSVIVKGENLLNGECTKSKLWLVDLAGSERVAKTEVQGDRLKETQNINRSLSALGDVISALANKSPHIPFRNSKLTHLLQDSLGGDSKTLMFVQISPNEKDLGETLCSLNFASRVRGIELGPARKQLDNTELLKYKQMAEKSKQEMKVKDLQMKKMEEIIHGLEVKIKEKDLKNKTMLEKFKELESQLLVERKLARQHVDTKISEQLQQQQAIQHEDQNNAPMRSKNLNEQARTKEMAKLNQPLLENGYKPLAFLPSTGGLGKLMDHSEKENNPRIAELFRLPKRTGRASVCTFAKRVPQVPAPRRSSLAPLPSIPSSMPLLPLPPHHQTNRNEEENNIIPNSLPEQEHCLSPKLTKGNNSKMLSSILRRSLHKKTKMKSSPRQQHIRRGGINVGMEKVRLSIGSRGRLAHRVLLSNARRAGANETQWKQSQKEKERVWI